MFEQPLTNFHLHLVSDATGETLLNLGRAAAVHFRTHAAIEHIHPLTRSENQIDKVLKSIEKYPGIVLYTLVNEDLVDQLENHCKELGCPCMSILQPVLSLFQTFLGTQVSEKVIAAQHTLNTEYFKRIEALNFTMMHDDGQNIETMKDADVVLLGISRTSKTPTSIYLANRGIKTANIPLVPNLPLDERILDWEKPLVIGLVASAERLAQIRMNRVLSLNAEGKTESYIEPEQINEELRSARRLFAQHDWKVIDVTRRSIEETAAAIISALNERKL